MTRPHPYVAGADADEMVPFRNDELPPQLQVGFVVGHCGHRVAGSEWKSGMRYCERCPDTKGSDL